MQGRKYHLSESTYFKVLGCASNSSTGPTSSFYLKIDGKGLLLDTGVDPIGRLACSEEDITKLEAVVVTHSHSDHCSGFANLVFTRKLLAKKLAHPPTPLSVYANMTTLETLRKQLFTQYPDRSFEIKWACVEEGIQHHIFNELKLSGLDNSHSVPTSSVRIDCNKGWSIGYQADGAPTPKYIDFFKEATVLILQVHSLTQNKDELETLHKKGQSGLGDAEEIVSILSPSVTIPYHLPRSFFYDPRLKELVRLALGKSSDIGINLLSGPWPSPDA